MYDHIIGEMARAATKGLREAKLPQDDVDICDVVRAALREYWTSRIADVWVFSDVREEAEQLGYTLDKEQCCEILQNVFNAVDASRGISWDVIDCAIMDFCCDRRIPPNNSPDQNDEIPTATPAEEPH